MLGDLEWHFWQLLSITVLTSEKETLEGSNSAFGSREGEVFASIEGCAFGEDESVGTAGTCEDTVSLIFCGIEGGCGGFGDCGKADEETGWMSFAFAMGAVGVGEQAANNKIRTLSFKFIAIQLSSILAISILES